MTPEEHNAAPIPTFLKEVQSRPDGTVDVPCNKLQFHRTDHDDIVVIFFVNDEAIFSHKACGVEVGNELTMDNLPTVVHVVEGGGNTDWVKANSIHLWRKTENDFQVVFLQDGEIVHRQNIDGLKKDLAAWLPNLLITLNIKVEDQQCSPDQ